MTSTTTIPLNGTDEATRRWYRSVPDYDPGLMILAFLVAVQAAYVAVYILKSHHLKPMVVLGALCFSVGSIFSMHFIAMAAESHVVPMNMNTGWTIGSVLFAFIPCAVAMVFLATSLPHQLERENTVVGNWQAFKEAPHLKLIFAAVMMSIGTAAMHWTATIGMFPRGVQKYDILWICITCVYLLVACIIALHCCFVLPLTKTYALPTAIVLSIATTGFHTWAAVLSVYVEVNSSLVEARPDNMMREVAPYIVFLSTVLSFISWFIATHFTRNSYAPTDENKPATIIFTDIQNSTKLYAKIPQEMQAANEMHHKLMLSNLNRFGGFFCKSVGDSVMSAWKDPLDALGFMIDTQILLNNTKWDPKINLMYKKIAMQALRKSKHGTSDQGTTRSGTFQNNNSNGATSASGLSDLEGSDHDTPLRNSSSQLSGPTGGGSQDSTNNTGALGYDNLESINTGAHFNGLRVRMGANHGSVSIVFDESNKTYDYFSNAVNCAARVEAASRGGQILVTRQLIDACGGEEAVKRKFNCEVESHGLYALRGMTENTELIEITPEPLILRRPFPPPNATPAAEAEMEDSIDEDELLAKALGQVDSTADEKHSNGGDNNNINNNNKDKNNSSMNKSHSGVANSIRLGKSGVQDKRDSAASIKNNSMANTNTITAANSAIDPLQASFNDPVFMNLIAGRSAIAPEQIQQLLNTSFGNRSSSNSNVNNNNNNNNINLIRADGAEKGAFDGGGNQAELNAALAKSNILTTTGNRNPLISTATNPMMMMVLNASMNASVTSNQQQQQQQHQQQLLEVPSPNPTRNTNTSSEIERKSGTGGPLLPKDHGTDVLEYQSQDSSGSREGGNRIRHGHHHHHHHHAASESPTNEDSNSGEPRSATVLLSGQAFGAAPNSSDRNEEATSQSGGGCVIVPGAGSLRLIDTTQAMANVLIRQNSAVVVAPQSVLNSRKGNNKNEGSSDGNTELLRRQATLPGNTFIVNVPPQAMIGTNNSNNVFMNGIGIGGGGSINQQQPFRNKSSLRDDQQQQLQHDVEFPSGPGVDNRPPASVANTRPIPYIIGNNNNNSETNSATATATASHSAPFAQKQNAEIRRLSTTSTSTTAPAPSIKSASMPVTANPDGQQLQKQKQHVTERIHGGGAENDNNDRADAAAVALPGQYLSSIDEETKAARETSIFNPNKNKNNNNTISENNDVDNSEINVDPQNMNVSVSGIDGNSNGKVAVVFSPSEENSSQSQSQSGTMNNNNNGQSFFGTRGSQGYYDDYEVQQQRQLVQQQQQQLLQQQQQQPSASNNKNEINPYILINGFAPQNTQQQQQQQQLNHSFDRESDNGASGSISQRLSAQIQHITQQQQLQQQTNQGGGNDNNTAAAVAPTADPEEVFTFVAATVHRLVRHRFSKHLVAQKLRAQLESFQILLHNITDVFVRRQIVREISRSWGHKNSFPTPTETIIHFFREFQGGYTKEQKCELEKEITCALTILSGRTLSRVLQNEKRASHQIAVTDNAPAAALGSLRNMQNLEHASKDSASLNNNKKIKALVGNINNNNNNNNNKQESKLLSDGVLSTGTPKSQKPGTNMATKGGKSRTGDDSDDDDDAGGFASRFAHASRNKASTRI